MKYRLISLLVIICNFNIMIMGQEKKIELRVLQTSDVHGCFFPYDFINRTPTSGSMARVSSYVKKLRAAYGDKLLLFDNGDILQGQPTCYFCNYVKPDMPNVAASIINYLEYDAQTIGNHDIETGHAVYDKWIKEVKCPMLGANIINTATGEPYLEPYHIFVRDGVRIAVLGLITPAIPNWLNQQLWSGMRFDNMVESAKKWIERIKANEHPDIIIGLFHSGRDGGITTSDYEENASLRIAAEIEGFDLILYGHDHRSNKEIVKGPKGESVLCLNPSSNANYVCDAQISLTIVDGKVVSKNVTGGIKDIKSEPIDNEFMSYFKKDIDTVNTFVNRKIGTFESSIFTRDSYFGNSAFCDFIHNLQLKITGADISFNAPLSFDTSIEAGDVHVSDMFNLYKYENQIYVLRMTGKEIHDYLEMSYALWTNTMTSRTDHIMLIEKNGNAPHGYGFKNLAFNFDSAAGIDYEVDVTKPQGQKIRIIRMSNGDAFDESKWYDVAMNSYRGNGGGELLTKGAKIPHDSLPGRIVYESERDQRYYLMKEIEKAGVMTPQPNDNWRFVPVDWTKHAILQDRKLLFGL